MDIQGALVTAMLADATLVSLVSTYKSVGAIFAEEPVPESADYPFIILSPTIGASNLDTTSEDGSEINVDVQSFMAEAGDSRPHEILGDRIRTVLNHATLTISGWTNVHTECQDPLPIPTDRTITGRSNSVRVILEK